MRDRSSNGEAHVPEEDLVRLSNGELAPERSLEIGAHLSECNSCVARLDEIQRAFEDYVELRREELDPRLPAIGSARAELRRRLATATVDEESWLDRLLLRPQSIHVGLGLAAFLMAAVAATLTSLWRPSEQTSNETTASRHFAPDPRLTPGLASPVSRAELCSAGRERPAAGVERRLALEVFESYGIANPAPRAYEIDYVIPPELGGASDARNLWPQPYAIQPWNAHAKDALEDYLLQAVCAGRMDLATAQRDLAEGWVAAYQKHFHTREPLVEHASFLRDEPWQ